MKFIIEKNYMVLKVEEKATVNLYTLIDLEQGDKITAVGVKSDAKLKALDVAAVTLSLTSKSEKVETKKDGVKYLQVLNTFVSKIEKVTV